MPITDREWEQIKVAIQAVSHIDVVGYGEMINRNNVFAILDKWREEKKLNKL